MDGSEKSGALDSLQDTFLKFHKLLVESSQRLINVRDQLFDYLMLLFSQEEDSEMGSSTLLFGTTLTARFIPSFYSDEDPAETARQIAKICELDEERRELVRKEDHITKQVIVLLSEQKFEDLKIDAAETNQLVTKFIKIDRRLKEDARSMDHFMSEVRAHCSAHLASIFEISYEE